MCVLPRAAPHTETNPTTSFGNTGIGVLLWPGSKGILSGILSGIIFGSTALASYIGIFGHMSYRRFFIKLSNGMVHPPLRMGSSEGGSGGLL